jgi:hypothetical protein
MQVHKGRDMTPQCGRAGYKCTLYVSNYKKVMTVLFLLCCGLLEKLVIVFKILLRSRRHRLVHSIRYTQTSLAVWLLLHSPRQIMVAAKGIDLPTAVLDVAPRSTTV